MDKSSTPWTETVKDKGSAIREELAAVLQGDTKNIILSGLSEYLKQGTQVLLEALMNAETQELCGSKYQRDSQRQFVRWGSENGTALVSGAKQLVCRPRVRLLRKMAGRGGEIELETYKAMNRAELIDGPLMVSILSGVSTRKYAAIVERGLRVKGIAKSTISRRAIAATKPTVQQFLNRQLHELNLVVILFDGIHVAKRQMIVCVGIDRNGRKHVLGLRLGATENEIVCRDLICDMIERGMDIRTKYLFVVDGSKALVRAIHAAFGQKAEIQRCQEHKIRNVQAYVPNQHRAWVRSKLQAAYAQDTFEGAMKRLDRFRVELSLIGCSKAVDSLTEGMYETLTVNRLGVTGLLRKSLRTTNIMESLFSSVRRYMGRVTKFPDEENVDLWVIRSLVEAEKHLRIVPGARQLAALRARLEKR